MIREPILESERYQLFMEGITRKAQEEGGEYGAFLYDVFWWEGQAVIIDKLTGQSTQFSCRTEEYREIKGLSDPSDVILRTDHRVQDGPFDTRYATADKICLHDKQSEVTDLVCRQILDKTKTDKDPIKKVFLKRLSFQELLRLGIVADNNDQIPLLLG